MPDDKTILVLGATGGQGGAVARRLLADGRSVRALVRDRSVPGALDLAAAGAELVAADLDDARSVRAAVAGADGVFCVLPADLADPDPATEVRRGRTVVDAAAAAEVRHLVYSSVGGADRPTGVAHFECKAEIEAYAAASGVPLTVLRPVFLMDNWLGMLPPPRNGERVGAIAFDPDVPLQMLAVADLARIAAGAFAAPRDYAGRTIELAGDELTVREVAARFTAADGVPTRFDRQPIEPLRAGAPDFAAMFAWFEREGFGIDIPGLRARHPRLSTFDDWLAARP